MMLHLLPPPAAPLRASFGAIQRWRDKDAIANGCVGGFGEAGPALALLARIPRTHLLNFRAFCLLDKTVPVGYPGGTSPLHQPLSWRPPVFPRAALGVLLGCLASV